MNKINSNAEGWGLIELMIVLTIGGLFYSIARPTVEYAKILTTKREMGMVVTAIQLYESEEDKLPSSINKLGGILSPGYDKDAWGDKYEYDKSDRKLCTDNIIINSVKYCVSF